MSEREGRGRLTLVSTPIGNLGDLSPRARAALEEADAWIVEDTRISGKLASAFELKKPMKVLNDHTSPGAIDKYYAELSNGANWALLTDGGTPAISDPGALLTDRCLEGGIEVDAIPGPSAVTTALALSGFFAQRFAFLGFLPRKAGGMRDELVPFVSSPLTLVLFESLHRLESLITVAGEVLGPRRYTLCRELTKSHQQVLRLNLPEVPSEADFPRKGELTLVIEGHRRTRYSTSDE